MTDIEKTAQKYDGDPYSSGIEPVIGGGVGVSVSGWGWWSVWINVESYADSDDYADTALQPGEAIRFAGRLVIAGVVCWWKRIPGRWHNWKCKHEGTRRG